MTERVKDLELQVMTKEQEIAQFRINEIQAQQKHNQSLEEVKLSRKDKDASLSKLEKSLKEKDYELEKLTASNKRLEDEVKHLSDKLGVHEKGYQEEYDRKFEELKQMYAE